MPASERRLTLERREVAAILPRFKLYSNISHRDPEWSELSWKGPTPDGHLLEARYPADYPHSQIQVSCSARLSTSHYIGEFFCLMEPHQWSPHYTAVTVLCIALRYLWEYRKGLFGR